MNLFVKYLLNTNPEFLKDTIVGILKDTNNPLHDDFIRRLFSVPEILNLWPSIHTIFLCENCGYLTRLLSSGKCPVCNSTGCLPAEIRVRGRNETIERSLQR